MHTISEFLTGFFRRRGAWLLMFVVYSFLIFVAVPHEFSVRSKIIFLFYGLFVFVSLYYILQAGQNDPLSRNRAETARKIFIFLLFFSFGLLLVTRLMPFVRYGETPLGYDTGLYVKNIQTLESPAVTEKAFYMILSPLLTFGMSPTFALHFIVVFTQILLAGAFYVLFRSINSPSRFGFAVVAVFLFVVSLTQFHAYWWMFARQMLSTGLFLITLALLFRRPALSALTGAAGVLTHPLPFIGLGVAIVIFVLVYVVKLFIWDKASYRKAFLFTTLGLSILTNILYWNWPRVADSLFRLVVRLDIFFKKDVSIFYPLAMVLVLATIILVFWLKVRKRFDKESAQGKIINYSVSLMICFLVVVLLKWDVIADQFRYFFRHYGLASNYPIPWGIPAVKGLFIDFSQFHLLTFILLPFFFFSLICPFVWRSKQADGRYPYRFLTLTYIMLAVLFILSYFPFIRQHRFIIILDLMIILFSVPTIYHIVKHFLKDRLGQFLLIVFFVVFTYRVGLMAWMQEPQIYADELQELRALANVAEVDARVMTTSTTYTTWAIGFSGRQAFGPGWEFDQWNWNQWLEFWMARGDETTDRRLELLARYQYPVYIFVGERENHAAPFYTFIESNQSLTKISAHVWKYDGQTMK